MGPLYFPIHQEKGEKVLKYRNNRSEQASESPSRVNVTRCVRARARSRSLKVREQSGTVHESGRKRRAEDESVEENYSGWFSRRDAPRFRQRLGSESSQWARRCLDFRSPTVIRGSDENEIKGGPSAAVCPGINYFYIPARCSQRQSSKRSRWKARAATTSLAMWASRNTRCRYLAPRRCHVNIAT